MVKNSTMFIAGITFSTGLFIGLLLHLPGVYSPVSSHLRNRREVMSRNVPVVHNQRTLLAAEDVDTNQEHHRTKSSSQTVHIKRNNSEARHVYSNVANNNYRDSKALRARINIASAKSDYVLNARSPVSKVGLLQTISAFKQPEVRGGNIPSQSKRNREEATISVNRKEHDGRTHGKHSIGSSKRVVNNNNVEPYAHSVNEIVLVNKEQRNMQPVGKVTEDEEEDELIAEDVIREIYWTDHTESNLVPRGFTQDDALRWRQVVNEGKVVRIEEGCGRMQNRKVTLDDGTVACARYRLNTDQMQGEMYSYYLAQLLDINNVPPSLLVLADTRTDTWGSVSEDVVAAQWNPGKVIALTPWLQNLKPAYIPKGLRHKDAKSITPNNIGKLTRQQLTELVQWSDLIVFDYLTANVDRVVNNMFNLQWNSAMMESPAHNLEKSTKDGHLVFLDNESGLFHSYRLLNRYSSYHEELLKSLCVFRQKTADAITRLYKSRDVGSRLQGAFEENEPLNRYLPRIPANNVNILQTRIDNVYNQIQHCHSLYKGNTSTS